MGRRNANYLVGPACCKPARLPRTRHEGPAMRGQPAASANTHTPRPAPVPWTQGRRRDDDLSRPGQNLLRTWALALSFSEGSTSKAAAIETEGVCHVTRGGARVAVSGSQRRSRAFEIRSTGPERGGCIGLDGHVSGSGDPSPASRSHRAPPPRSGRPAAQAAPRGARSQARRASARRAPGRRARE